MHYTKLTLLIDLDNALLQTLCDVAQIGVNTVSFYCYLGLPRG